MFSLYIILLVQYGSAQSSSLTALSGMLMARAAGTQKQTRIQREKSADILRAALSVFGAHGFRGATVDMIAQAAGLSKPNLLYYFRSKEVIHTELLNSTLSEWLEPLENLNPAAENPVEEFWQYVEKKLELAKNHPRESRLFANEILQGAPRLQGYLHGALKALVEREAAVLETWMAEGKIARLDPYHLIFSIWAMTQHYADFDVQVCAVLGKGRSETRFDDAKVYLRTLIEKLLSID
jgi:TetR/AcrR family transcriptional regulator